MCQDYHKITSWASRCFWHFIMITSWCVKIIIRLFQDDLLIIKMLLAFIHDLILMCQDHHKIIPGLPLDNQDAFGIYSWLDLDVSRLSQDYLLSIKMLLAFFRGDILLYQDNYKMMPRWHLTHQDASGIYSRWHQSYCLTETPLNVFKLTQIVQCCPSQVYVWASTST